MVASAIGDSRAVRVGTWSAARRRLAALAVALALAAGLSVQIGRIAGAFPDNIALFSSPAGPAAFPAAWSGRLASRVLAFRFVLRTEGERFSPQRVGAWTGVWFLLAALSLVALRGDSPWIYGHLLGGCAGISLGYFLDWELRVYPWDLPAYFFFTLGVALYARGRALPLVLLVPVAVAFKETALLLVILLAFLPGSVAKRTALVAAGLALGFGAKLALDLWAGSDRLVLTMSTHHASELLLVTNLRYLRDAWASPYSPLLFNAGTLLALLLVPAAGTKARALRLLAGVFALSVFLFGFIREARVWFELLPVALFALELDGRAARSAAAGESAAPELRTDSA